MDLNCTVLPSIFGEALICWEPENRDVIALLFGDDKVDRIHQIFKLENYFNLNFVKDDEFATEVIERVNSGKDLEGISFRYIWCQPYDKKVYKELRKIPVGETRSYGEIAELVSGNRNDARIVARACNNNKLAILVPCHRVIMKNGEIGGYRWGVEMKKKLLDREANL